MLGQDLMSAVARNCCHAKAISRAHHSISWPFSCLAAIFMSLGGTGLFAANALAQAGKALGRENICLSEARRGARHSERPAAEHHAGRGWSEDGHRRARSGHGR